MLRIAGGDIVLPDRILANAALVVDGERIARIEDAALSTVGMRHVDVAGMHVVPGFVDVHVHGVEDHDTLDAGDAIAAIAARLPRYGVTAFCPTTVACDPARLGHVLEQVARARARRPVASARVLPAHLESNFISPDYAGAQPCALLRLPSDESTVGGFSGSDIVAMIESRSSDVGIVTVAPELPGVIDLISSLTRAGVRVALGHSGADFDQATRAIDAGARHATHLFNRMAPVTHKAPGVAGAVLVRPEVMAELIVDGLHVHPAVGRLVIAAKGAGAVIAITDGTAGAGLPPGSTTRLGGRLIRVSGEDVRLEDGTRAGSTLTMDQAFRNLVARFGASIVDAARMCATTPAQALGRAKTGLIAADCLADLVVLDSDLRVRRTFIGGEEVYRAG